MEGVEKNTKRGYFNRHSNLIGVAVEKKAIVDVIKTWEPYVVRNIDYPFMMEVLARAHSTIDNMFKGKIGSIAAGRKMVEFMQPIIDERIKKSNDNKAA